MKVKEKQFNEDVDQALGPHTCFRSLKRTHDMFLSLTGLTCHLVTMNQTRFWQALQSRAMYGNIKEDVDRLKNMPDSRSRAKRMVSRNGENGAVAVYKAPI